MKKSVFYYLFAVICTVCLFTACSDDDDDDNKVLTVDNIVGTYPGDLDVTLAGTEVAKDVAASIVVTRVDDSKVKVSLSNFTIPGLLPVPMTIDATCDVVPSTNELKLNGQTTIDMSALGMGELAVVITGDADALASILRRLSLLSALASASNASMFWMRILADLISPVALTDCRSGDICASSVADISSESE